MNNPIEKKINLTYWLVKECFYQQYEKQTLQPSTQPCACWLPNTNTKVTFRVPNRWYCWSQGAAASTIQVILSYSLDPSVDPVSNASMHVVLGLSLQVRKVTPQQNIQPWVSTLIWNDETWEYIYVIVTLQIVRTTFFNLAWSNCSNPKPLVSNLPFRKAQ